MNNFSRQTVCVIGQGYVGLPLSIAATYAGYRVYGIDNSEKKITQLKNAQSPIEDIKDSQIRKAMDHNMYYPTDDFQKVSEADIVLICVPTPLNKSLEPDLSHLEHASKEIAKFLKDETLVISESTSYPGTLRNFIIPLVDTHKNKNVKRLFFASAPERVNPLDAKWNLKNTPRLVGAVDKEAQELAIKFYNSICDEVVVVSSPEIAETAKLLENTFRLVNIGLINEFARVCFESNINISEVIEAASTKPYGFMPFKPGVGVGGHCIPVDPLYFTWWAKTKDIECRIINESFLVNKRMHKYIAHRALELIGPGKSTLNILILGLAYKTGVSDTRESPSVDLFNYLLSLGHNVSWYDPLIDVSTFKNKAKSFNDFDLVIISTYQDNLPIDEVISSDALILDTTNSFQNLRNDNFYNLTL